MARISDASSARMMPSLSVVHVDPSRRRNDAPALSSPPKPMVPLINPSTNHLNPTGTSSSLRPRPAPHRPPEQLAPEAGADPVDDRRADRGLADSRRRGPLRAIAVEVFDRHGQIV